MKRFKDLKVGDHLFFTGGWSMEIRSIEKEHGQLQIRGASSGIYHIPLNHLKANRLQSRFGTTVYTNAKSWHRIALKQLEKRYQELKQIEGQPPTS